MKEYLAKSNIVDLDNIEIVKLASNLANGCKSEIDISKKCFEYVRDNIKHSGDYKAEITTLKASEVLKHKTGWCYSKAILLAALLRANSIPTGFCYQRLKCFEYEEGTYCLHGLNAIYLKEFGWYRVDARGNKDGVDAQFIPPKEKLAFEAEDDEYDLPTIYTEPITEIINALSTNKNYKEMVANFPDIK